MPGATMEFDRSVTTDERAVLKAKKDAFLAAFMWKNLYATAVEDGNRRVIRVTTYGNRGIILAQFDPRDIEKWDSEQFKTRLVGGDFTPQPMTQQNA